LRDRADAIQEENWTQERRAKIAGEVKDVFNIIAQVVQGADPNFVSGQG
jgi:hypothetical protein